MNSSILNSDCHIAHLSGFSEHLQDSKDETEKNLEEKKVILISFYCTLWNQKLRMLEAYKYAYSVLYICPPSQNELLSIC